jgi:hypothetical protein
MSDQTTAEMRTAMRRRIVVYQCLYAFATLTCLVNTYLAIGLLIVFQLQRGDRPEDPDPRLGVTGVAVAGRVG